MAELTVPLARTSFVSVPAQTGRAKAEVRSERTAVASESRAGSVRFEAVGKTYISGSEPVRALNGIDAEVPEGSIFGIIGRSGAGKSSLLRLVNRLEEPTEGRVLVDGEDIAKLDTDGLVAFRRRVGMVFQHFNLLSAKTVRENVALPLLVAGVPKPEIERRVREVLALVGLEGKEKAYPSRLSGGQKQRVGIARALVSRPEILLCDEATSALDPVTTLQILALLKDINRRLDLTIILITHEMSVIREICDRVLVLERGEIVETGPVWQVFGNPRHDATRALLEPLQRKIPGDLAARLSPTPLGGEASETVIELRYSGAAEPDLAALVGRFPSGLRVLDASLDRIVGHAQGRILIAARLAPGEAPNLSDLPAAEARILGYV